MFYCVFFVSNDNPLDYIKNIIVLNNLLKGNWLNPVE